MKKVAFLSLVPLEKLFDFGGEQMALYVGRDLGDLIIITLNKCVNKLHGECRSLLRDLLASWKQP